MSSRDTNAARRVFERAGDEFYRSYPHRRVRRDDAFVYYEGSIDGDVWQVYVQISIEEGRAMGLW